MQTHWVPRPFERADLPSLLELRRRVFQEDGYDERRWAWEYEGNPQGRPIIWLAVDRNDSSRLAGHYAIISYRLKVGDRVVSASQSLDTYTSPDFRNQGIFVGLANRAYDEAEGKGVSVVFGFPNSSSFPGFTGKLSFQTPLALYHYIRPLRLGYVLERVPGGRLLGSLTGITGARLTRRAVRSGETFRKTDELPGDWSALQEAFEAQFPILVKRDADTMRWRFFECPDRRYSCHELRRDGELSGFAVLRIVGSVGHVVDLLAKEDSWDALIRSCVSALVEEGASSALLYAHPENPLARRFSRHGFIRVGSGTRFIVRELGESGSSPDLSDARSWFLMGGDTDYF